MQIYYENCTRKVNGYVLMIIISNMKRADGTK